MKRPFNLPEQDVYDIRPLESINELLVPETSLCIVHNPCWDKTKGVLYNGYDWLAYSCAKGTSNSGIKEEIDVLQSHIHDLGRYKSRLDKHLLSAFLFVSWRKHLEHTFRMFQQHELIAEFPDLESAMAAYMPDGFIPRQYYCPADTLKHLYFRSLERRRAMFSLLRLLHRRVEQLSAKVCSEFKEQDALEPNEED